MKVTILNKIMERSTFVKSFKPRGCLRCITYLKGKKKGILNICYKYCFCTMMAAWAKLWDHETVTMLLSFNANRNKPKKQTTINLSNTREGRLFASRQKWLTVKLKNKRFWRSNFFFIWRGTSQRQAHFVYLPLSCKPRTV
jgi:hypothetical protein